MGIVTVLVSYEGSSGPGGLVVLAIVRVVAV
jgi:hypothetical protein